VSVAVSEKLELALQVGESPRRIRKVASAVEVSVSRRGIDALPPEEVKTNGIIRYPIPSRETLNKVSLSTGI
jgi:hypothetical protein